MSYQIGVDIGGTFTDIVCHGSDGKTLSSKIMSTRSDPSIAVSNALKFIRSEWGIEPGDVRQFLHGTTVATNAVLERSGAKLGLLTTRGFEDVLEIGRQWRSSREDLYASILAPQTPIFLAPGRFRYGVRERMSSEGEVVEPLDEKELRKTLAQMTSDGIQSVAICYLFSFKNPKHEQRTRDIIREEFPGIRVSLSSDVDPMFREYERTVVTAFDAYIKSVVDKYLSSVEAELAESGISSELKVMQSRGGLAFSRQARERPVRLFLSGPAAGVTGASAVGREGGVGNIITVDIGGTSCDIALIREGVPEIKHESLVDGFSVRVPSVDVNAIGAGGGSMAWLDNAGGLRVGPQSAGSEPGPACYGKGGTRPTVTDASIVLGIINPDYFAGGTIPLFPELARKAIEEHIARPLGMSVEEAALGIHRLVNSQMAEGIKLVSIRRGYDVRDFSLMPYGGGGPVHATALANELQVSSVTVPLRPGVLCAQGLLAAHIHYEASVNTPFRLSELSGEHLTALTKQVAEDAWKQVPSKDIQETHSRTIFLFDMSFEGQSYHLEIRIPEEDEPTKKEFLRDRFLQEHQRIYGYAGDAEIRLINLRCLLEFASGGSRADISYSTTSPTPLKGERMVRFAGESGGVMAKIYDRFGMPAGYRFEGPAIVEQADTTTVVQPGWSGTVEPSGLLVLRC